MRQIVKALALIEFFGSCENVFGNCLSMFVDVRRRWLEFSGHADGG